VQAVKRVAMSANEKFCQRIDSEANGVAKTFKRKAGGWQK